MNPSFLRIAIAFLIIAHGLNHPAMAAIPVAKIAGTRAPFWPSF
jgi:hypothetical protein